MKSEKSENTKWTTVIKPHAGLFDVNFKELWAFKDLWALFVRRDIVVIYKQTILGPAWFFIQPLLTTIMFMVVFGGIAGISTDGLPQPLFYMAGITMWQYFADCLNKTSSIFIANANIFGKVYFPRLVMPLAIVTSNLLRFFIQLTLFILIYLYYVIFTDVVVAPNIYLLLFPVLIMMLAGLALGFGILFSSLTTKYRDLTQLLGFFVQLWMYATPVIYPLSTITNENVRFVMLLNPLTSILEAFKFAVLGNGTFSWWYLGYSFIFMVVLMGIGIVVFNRIQRKFMDTV